MSDDSDNSFVSWKIFRTLHTSDELRTGMRSLSRKKPDTALLDCRWTLECLGHQSLPVVQRALGHPCRLGPLDDPCHLCDHCKKRDWMTLMGSSPTFCAHVTSRTFLSRLATITNRTCDSLWTSVSMLSVGTHHRHREERS